MQAKTPLVEVVRRNIRARLASTGKTKAEIQRAAQLNESAIRNILEGGANGPTVASLGKLAEQLGCTAADLLSETGEAPAAATPPTEGDPIVTMQQHEPGFVRVHINQVVTADQFVRLMQILTESEEKK